VWKPGRAVTDKEAEKPVTLPVRERHPIGYSSPHRNIFTYPRRAL
jgi:hypothetical protein